MFDFMRDRGSTADDKRREALGAYLDNALTPAERDRLDSQLSRDPALRADLEQMRLLKLQMRAMPRRRVPRSFALDPALYGRPKAQPMMQLYPVLRGATALTAFFLIFTLALGAFRGQFTDGDSAPAAAGVVMTETMAQESAPLEAAEESQLLEPPPAAEQDRAMATDAPAMGAAAEAPPELAAPEPESSELAVEEAAGSEMAVTAVPEGDLNFSTTAPTPEPTFEPVIESMATAVASSELPADGTANVDPTAPVDAGTPASTTLLRPLQIGLGVAFVVLLALWLFARRRVRSL